MCEGADALRGLAGASIDQDDGGLLSLLLGELVQALLDVPAAMAEGAPVGEGHHAARRLFLEVAQFQRGAEKVRNGELKDLVLSFMLRQGLQPIQIIPGYLDDEESLDHAVIVEWKNPNL